MGFADYYFDFACDFKIKIIFYKMLVDSIPRLVLDSPGENNY